MPNSNNHPLIDEFPALQQDRIGALLTLDGVITHVNEYTEEFFQRADIDLIGRHFMEITHPDWIGIDVDLFNMLKKGEKNFYVIPRKVWVDPFGKEISGRLFAARCKVDGNVMIYGGITPYIDSGHSKMPHITESKSYTAFGLPEEFWKGVSNLIKSIDVWKLLVVVSGIVIALYLLRDVLPQIWGG